MRHTLSKESSTFHPSLNSKSLTVVVRDLSRHNEHDHGTLGKGGSGAVVAVAAGGDRQEGASVSVPASLPAPHRHVSVEGMVVASGSGTDTV